MSGPESIVIDARTRYCAVYGHPIAHSASPAMQNAGIKDLQLNWRYLAFDVPPDQLRAAIAGAKAMRFLGLNLTVPHKLLAMDIVDALDASARQWGAVNTIRFEGRGPDGAWLPLGRVPLDFDGEIRTQGFNTDADAIIHALREDLGLDVAGLSILLLGAGGAGRVAALRLAQAGAASLYLVNRTQSKAEQLAAEIAERFPGGRVQVGYPDRSVDLLLNATSLGLKSGDPLPLDAARFELRQARAVYDMIYRPAETELLRLARAAQCRVANGLGMLLAQGAKALAIWTERPAPVAVMRRALEANVYGR